MIDTRSELIYHIQSQIQIDENKYIHRQTQKSIDTQNSHRYTQAERQKHTYIQNTHKTTNAHKPHICKHVMRNIYAQNHTVRSTHTYNNTHT